MNIDDYVGYDAMGLAALIRSGQVSVDEVHIAARAAIAAVNPSINALAAPLFDAPLDYNRDGPFAGVPFVIKDVGAHAAGVPQRMGTRLLPADFSFPEDTELMKRFRAAGLATIGRTTTPEWGFSPSAEALVYGPTRNPWDTTRSSGGSSGGSCALVAARGLPVAHANDGGGSIRIPAALCGLVGLKPTRGRVSLAPNISFTISIEFAVTHTLRDAAALLDAVEGHGIGERFEIARPATPYAREVGADPGKLRIAVSPKGWAQVPIDPACVAAVEKTAKLLADMGHHVEEATPRFDFAAYDAAFQLMFVTGMPARVNALAKLVGATPSPDNLEATSWSAYELGKGLPVTVLLEADQVMNTTSRAVGAFFQDYDVLLTPSVSRPAWPLGYMNANDPNVDALSWIRKGFALVPFSNLFNVTGHPAMSLPLCMSDDGLPIGLQFVARYGDEATLFRLAAALEQAMPWAGRRPPVCAGSAMGEGT